MSRSRINNNENLEKSMKHFIYAILFLLLGLVSVSSAEQKQELKDSDGKKVLFIGNSYTFFHDMPKMLGQMVEAVRLKDGGVEKLICSKALKGGASLQWHWEHPRKPLVKLIGNQEVKDQSTPVGYDYVVLQDESLGALKPVSRERMFKYARLICEAAKAKGVTPVFYMTWGRRVTFNPDGSGKMADRKFMYEEMCDGESVVIDPKIISSNDGIAKTYRKIADEVGGKVAPCGIAFAKAIKAGVVVHSEKEKDGSHPNLTGSYLVACVFYGTIYDRNPEEIPDDLLGEIRPKLAAKLQAIAKLAVQEEKRRKADMHKGLEL